MPLMLIDVLFISRDAMLMFTCLCYHAICFFADDVLPLLIFARHADVMRAIYAAPSRDARFSARFLSDDALFYYAMLRLR